MANSQKTLGCSRTIYKCLGCNLHRLFHARRGRRCWRSRFAFFGIHSWQPHLGAHKVFVYRQRQGDCHDFSTIRRWIYFFNIFIHHWGRLHHDRVDQKHGLEFLHAYERNCCSLSHSWLFSRCHFNDGVNHACAGAFSNCL